MHTVKVKTGELIKRVTENKDNHRRIVLEVMDRYRALAIEELDAMLAEARKGKKIRRSVMLVEPQDHTRDYERILEMLKMHTESEIEITEAEFAMYVLDDWGWKQQWSTSNSHYLSGR